MKGVFKSGITVAVCLSLAISPVAVPVTVQAQQNEPEAVANFLRTMMEGDTLFERLEALEQQRERDTEAINALTAQLKDQQAALEGARASVVSLSQALASLEAQGKRTANLAQEAAAAIPQASSGLQELLRKAHGTIQPGNWVQGLDDQEVLARMDNVRGAAEAVKEELQQRHQQLETHLSVACKGSPIAAAIRTQLGPFIGGVVPPLWNSGLAAIAASSNIPLPSCFNARTAEGRTVKEELQQYITDKKAGQQMAEAMSSMLMVAVSTANPYIVAAAFAIMVLMAVFRQAGGGGGEGTGRSRGDSKPQGDSRTGTSASHDSSGESRPGGKGRNDTNLSQPPQKLDKVLPPQSTYTNVVDGMDTWVEVLGQAIRFTNSRTGKVWDVTWPPTVPNSDIEIPDFTPEVRILAADVENKTFRVEMPIARCGGRLAFDITADATDPNGLIVTNERAGSCLF